MTGPRSPVAVPGDRLDAARTGSAATRVPGLDGLRGVAVAWVVAFHLWPETVRGGWLGVGLFFTLSGYLIIGLIDTEVSATGRLRLGRFMARRVRRLMPAALVTISASVALTAALTDDALRSVGLDALTAALNVFNWRAATDPGGYAAIFEVTASPLEHFWSLAIEEQFYLVVPAAMALTRRPVAVVAAMVVAGLGGVALWWGSSDAYVATPVRALEIAAGAGLALAGARSEAVRRLLRWDGSRTERTVSLGLLVAVLAVSELAVVLLGPGHGTVFRGAPQLMAACWVVLLAGSLPGGPLAPLMSLAPLRWLGTRSYAIYLFHWPLIELTDWGALPVIAVTLMAAEASYRFIEMPVRRGTGRRAVLVLVGALIAVASGTAVVAAASSPARGAGERAAGVTALPEWMDPQGSTADATEQTTPAAPETPAPERRPDATTPDTTEPEPTATDTTATDTTATDTTATDTAAPDTTATDTVALDATATDTTALDPAALDTADGQPAEQLQPPQEGPGDAPIVTVIGDSAAIHVADGLRQWGDANRAMAVVDRAVAACSPVVTADHPWRVVRTGDDTNPRNVVEREEPCRYVYIEPNSSLVLVVDHVMPLFDHLRHDGSWASVLDDDLAADLFDSYRELVEDARGAGATVVFATMPRLLPGPDEPGPAPPAADPARADAYNRIVRAVVEELAGAGPDGEPDPVVIDTARGLNASGYDGRYARSDGAHIDFQNSIVFASEVLGPALLDVWDETQREAATHG